MKSLVVTGADIMYRPNTLLTYSHFPRRSGRVKRVGHEPKERRTLTLTARGEGLVCTT